MSMIGNYVPLSPGQLAELKADPSKVQGLLYPDDGDSEPPGHVCIDKAWHAIHFLLNGSPWKGELPWFNVVIGGVTIGDDVGYGPARFLEPAQVQELASALATLTPADLERRFDPATLIAEDIYPSLWTQGTRDGLDYVQSHFRSVVAFFREAAARGDAALLYVN